MKGARSKDIIYRLAVEDVRARGGSRGVPCIDSASFTVIPDEWLISVRKCGNRPSSYFLIFERYRAGGEIKKKRENFYRDAGFYFRRRPHDWGKIIIAVIFFIVM